jgi:hypothetical protein
VGAACSTSWKLEVHARISVGRPEETELFRRSRYRCEDNIKMDHKEVGDLYGPDSGGSE